MKIQDFLKDKHKKELPNWIIPVKKLVHNRRIPDCCKLPYPRHPKGCPNYGKRKVCPPQAPYITDILNIKKPIYMVVHEFDLWSHMKKMEKKHPNWSDAQLRNVLYWQGTSKKELKKKATEAILILGTTAHCTLPEAAGVNVYATAFHSGLKLERIKEIKTNRHITIIGYK